MSRRTKNRLLFVSPETPGRERILRLLEKEGFDTVLAETGEKALRIVQDQLLDGVILDYGTRYAASGRMTKPSRTLQAITDDNPFLPLVLLCEATDELSYAETRMADMILVQPVESGSLLDALDTVLTETLSERALRKAGSIPALR